MTWTDALKVASAGLGIVSMVVVPVAYAAIRWWGSRIWAPVGLEEEMATQDDLDELRSRVSQVFERHQLVRELAEQNDDRIARVEQEVQHQSERVMEHVIPALREVAEDLKNISHGQATLEARVDSGFSSLGRSVDELRSRIERQEDRS